MMGRFLPAGVKPYTKFTVIKDRKSKKSTIYDVINSADEFDLIRKPLTSFH